MTDVRCEVDARGVAWIRLDRAEKHNALTPEMLGALEGFAEELAGREDLRVVVLAAEGRSFCAGGDLAWFRAQKEQSREERLVESRRIATALSALYALPHPLVARVQGNAFGGGVGLVSICDHAVGVEGLRMGLTETKLGVIPANIGPYVVARLGPRASQVFMNSRLFNAAEAQSLGLLSRVVPESGLDAAVEAEIAPYLACAPGAVRAAKRLMRDLLPPVTPEQVDLAVEALADRWESEEASTGLDAFFAQQPLPWTQR